MNFTHYVWPLDLTIRFNLNLTTKFNNYVYPLDLGIRFNLS